MSSIQRKTSKGNRKIAGVQFSKSGKVYHFDSTRFPALKIRDKVIVQTSRGWQLGEITQIFDGEGFSAGKRLKPISRMATPRDLLMRQHWREQESSVIDECKKVLAEDQFKGVKAVSAEYGYDGSNLTVLVTSANDSKIRLKQLRYKLSQIFNDTDITVSQIGPRDVAKIVEGIGACGLEKRCCAKFLSEFSSISIKMAKQQSISLTPTEITGICGRLRCCLIYEYEQYIEAQKSLPRKNKRVRTPAGDGKVISVLALKGTVYVDIPDVGRREFSQDEIEIISSQPTRPPTKKKRQ